MGNKKRFNSIWRRNAINLFFTFLHTFLCILPDDDLSGKSTCPPGIEIDQSHLVKLSKPFKKYGIPHRDHFPNRVKTALEIIILSSSFAYTAIYWSIRFSSALRVLTEVERWTFREISKSFSISSSRMVARSPCFPSAFRTNLLMRSIPTRKSPQV
jgi:hypothetical protein